MPWKMGSVKMTLDPATRARAVIRIGLVRALQALITASVTVSPLATSSMEKSTSRMELRTMMPARAMNPIMDVAVKSAPMIQCPGTMPSRVKGMGAMITPGVTKLPNSPTTSM